MSRRKLDAIFIKYRQRLVLNSDRQALTQERRRAWLLVYFRPSSFTKLLTPYAGGLDDEGNKVDASNDVRILGGLIQFCRRRSRPSQCTAVLDVRLRMRRPTQDIDLSSTELVSLRQVAFPHWCTTSVAHVSPRCMCL